LSPLSSSRSAQISTIGQGYTNPPAILQADKSRIAVITQP